MTTALVTPSAKEHLSLSFHRGFALYRSGVQAVLISAMAGQDISKDNILENTTLGTVQAEAMPRYAERCGLLNEDRKPTLFCELAGEYDQSLARASTQWVMHYYLSAPHRFAPNYWNFLALQPHPVGEIISTGEVEQSVAQFAQEATGKEPSDRTKKGAASAFVGTYSREDCLGQLGFLESQGQGSGQYLVADPNPISAGAFACILSDYWENVWRDRGDVLLGEVTQGPLARLLRAEGLLGGLLKTLEKQGLVHLQRKVPPFQVVRLWDDVPSVWRKHLYS